MTKISRTAPKSALCMLGIALLAISLSSCEKSSNDSVTTDKEAALQQVVAPYVNNTVIATYSAMADAGLTLLEQTQQILAKVEAQEDYSQLMAEAGTSWRLMRKHWEQSEAFLFGPASAHNIDPHIDSWPLDFNAMNGLLNDAVRMERIEEEGGAYVGDILGDGLKGFHAAEYLLFESVETEGRAIGTGKTHAANLTHAEAIYLLGIIEDLVQQSILLEYCWRGDVSAEKMQVLEDGEVDVFEDNYGHQMMNAGKPGSIYVSYQEVAEEIIAGAVDIAGEVANLKLGNPYISNTPEQRDYIESPYSCTSTIDFADNIRSIQHAYCGAQEGDASISDYVRKQDASLDKKVRQAIDDAIAAIDAIEDFENNAQGDEKVKAAIDKVAELEEVLDKEVKALLSK
ncbi:MAG: hypothetical protein J6T32_03285 [Paludibacteraceae bacterium]|nr:hypothetical protein [Paludibacteraceae bacterium]